MKELAESRPDDESPFKDSKSAELSAGRPSKRSGGWRIFARQEPVAVIALVAFLLILFALLFGNSLRSVSPFTTDVTDRLSAPSGAHPFGTDELGRDVLARVLLGGRESLTVGFISIVVSSTAAWALGVICAYLGGWVDWIVQRVAEIMMGIPILILALALVTALGQSTFNLSLAIAVAFFPSIFRVVRAQALVASEEDFVRAAVALGASPPMIMLRHIVPHTLSTLLVVTSSFFGGALLLEASLSFLGLGIAPPTPTWGQMIGDSVSYVDLAPWLAIFPGAVLSLTVFLVMLIGDAIRDYFDPKKLWTDSPARMWRSPGRTKG